MKTKAIEAQLDNVEQKLDTQLENEKLLNKYYALIAFLWSFVIGGVYAWLFTWEAVGISHVLFFIFFEASVIVPVILIEKNNGIKRISLWFILSMLASLLSVSFLYRLDIGWGILTFITLPVINVLLLSATFFPDTLKHVGFLSIVTLPFKVFISWFVDLFNFFKNIDFKLIKSTKIKSIISRTLFGLFMGLLALFIFVPLLSMADQVFAQFVGDFFRNTFGDWFKNFDSSLSTIGKFIVGMGVAGYSSIFLFSLWNKNSYLKELMDGNVKHPIDEVKRNWDVLSSSIFMLVLNIVFALFVAVQFKYLFGGEQNILGLNANYNYADYARKGFSELVTVSILVYFICVLLNSKVYAANLVQKIFFRANFVVMVISTLIITYAAYARLNLLQVTYGYTGTRLFGFFCMGVIALIYIFLLISALLKSPWKFINITTIIVLSCSYVILIMTPSDYVVAKLNTDRYKNSGKIDLPYMFSLQDEAIPVLVDLAKDDAVDYNIRTAIMANLETKWDRIKGERLAWQSYNVIDQYNKEKLTEAFTQNGSSSYRKIAESRLNLFLTDYASLIKKGYYDEAYSKYWSKNSAQLDLSTLSKLYITSYDVQQTPSYDTWNVVNISSDGLGEDSYDYWNGMTVDVKLGYTTGNTLPTQPLRMHCEKVDTLTLTLEDGQWKIINASQITLANFKDKGSSRANFYQNPDLTHLVNADYLWGCTSTSSTK